MVHPVKTDRQWMKKERKKGAVEVVEIMLQVEKTREA